MPFGLPVIGQVAAGQPVLAEQNIERTVAVDPGLFRPRADYLLRVRGDSMIEAGILPGDLVAVHRTRGVHDREIAVVRLEDEVTVKRWSTAGRGADVRVVLEPANAALAPIVVDPRRMTVAVEGLVVGLVRPDVAGRGAR
jgi:repressor LexA